MCSLPTAAYIFGKRDLFLGPVRKAGEGGGKCKTLEVFIGGLGRRERGEEGGREGGTDVGREGRCVCIPTVDGWREGGREGDAGTGQRCVFFVSYHAFRFAGMKMIAGLFCYGVGLFCTTHRPRIDAFRFAGPCQNVFSYDRMCSLTIECVLFLVFRFAGPCMCPCVC